MAGNILKGIVADQSDGLYELNYSDINISAVDKEISVDELSLIKIRDADVDTTNQVYQISILKLELSLGSLLSIYFSNEFSIEGIRIYDPKIEIYSIKSGKKKTSFSLETGSLYNSISRYLKAFSINNLDIKNAAVEFQKQDIENPVQVFVDQINFSVANFLLDSMASSDDSKFLYTDKIELIISNQSFSLPDSIHDLSFDEFSISTATGDILLKNLNLTPKSNLRLDSLESYYKIRIPEFNFRGLDFGKAYAENKLVLDSLKILNPDIQIHNTSSKKRKTKKTDLLYLSTSLFKTFEIQKLLIEKARVDVNIKNENIYTSKEVNFKITGIEIDSINSKAGKWIDLFQGVSIDATDFRTYLMDSTHLLTANDLTYSSFDASLGLSQLSVKPITFDQNPISIWLSLDKITAEGLTSLSNLSEGKIYTDHISLVNPNIDLDITNMKNNPDRTRSEFLDQIKVGEFSLTNGDLTLKSLESDLKIKTLDLDFKKVFFDPDDPELFLFNEFASNSHIDLKSLVLQSKKIDVKLNKLNLSDWKDLTVSDIYMKPTAFIDPIKFAEIKVTEFDLDHFLHNQLLSFDSLIVDKPVFKIHPNQKDENDAGKLAHWAHHTSFKEVHFKNGQLTKYGDEEVEVHLENFDIELSKFHFDSLRNEYYTLLGYRSDSIYLRLEKMNHLITGTDLSISINDSTLHVSELHMKPISAEGSKQISISTHELRLRQIDFHKLINEQKIHFHSGHLLSPKADISISNSEKGKQKMKGGLVKFNSLNVSNGQLHFEKSIKDSSMTLNIEKFNMLINEFDLGADSTIFSAKNYLGDMKSVSFKGFGKKDAIKISDAFINTKKGNLTLNDINLSPNSSLIIQIPKVEVKGLNPETLAHQKMIAIDSLKIDSPNISVDLNKKGKKQNKESNIPTFSANNFSITKGNLNLKKEGLNFDKDLKIKDINISIDSLSVDSTSTAVSLSENLSNTQLSFSDFLITTPDSLYNLKLGLIEYNGSKNILGVRDISLDPLLSKEQFQNYFDYQKDWFDMKVKSVEISGLNSKRVLEENYIELDNILVSKLNLDTHKDKRLPLPPDHEKPLPQQLISDIPIPFYLRSINIDSSFVSHSEFSETGTLPGFIFFQDLNGEIKNISNDQVKLEQSRVMTFHSTGTMMNTGHFDVDVDFDLMDTTQFFYFKGELNGMDLRELNTLLENTAFVRIKDGFNKHVAFNFEANHDYAIGQMKFYYDDLKIKVLKPNDEMHKSHAASIKSFFANTFVVSKKNPHLLIVRQGDIFHHRDVNKAIFNYWSKALLSGVISSIGAKNNKKEIKKLNEELKAQMDRKRLETLERVEIQSQSN